MDEVELDVLAGGDVQDAVRVFLGALGEHVELLRCDAAVRDLDAQHARRVEDGVGAFREVRRVLEALLCLAVVPQAVVVALPVGAAPKPGLSEDPFLHPALLAKFDLGFEDIDLLGEILGHGAEKALSPAVCAAHPGGPFVS